MPTPENYAFARLCVDAIQVAKQSAASQKLVFTRKDAIDLIARLDEGRLPVVPQPKPRKARTPPITTTDEAWLQGLEQSPVYAGIDIRRELGKAQAWAGERKTGVTRKRFINWLNKVERPITYMGAGKSSFQVPPKVRPVYSIANPVPGWPMLLRNYILTNESQEEVDKLLAMDWKELPEDIRQKIVNSAS